MSDLNFIAAANQTQIGDRSDDNVPPIGDNQHTGSYLVIDVQKEEEEDSGGENKIVFAAQGLSSIIKAEQRQKMTDAASHWKVRTSTIDEIHIAIQNCIDTDP